MQNLTGGQVVAGSQLISQATQLFAGDVARSCLDAGGPEFDTGQNLTGHGFGRVWYTPRLAYGTERQFTICSHKNIEMFTNLRPGRIARDVRQYAQKGSDYSLPFVVFI